MIPLEAIVTWKWATPGYRSTYTGDHVNALFRMVRRHYPRPIRQICVTDDRRGIDDGIEVLPDFGDFVNVPSPHGGKNPSCYRRLRMYHPDAARWFGRRFASLDLDTVICGPLAALWDRPEDIVLWGDGTNPQPSSYYNGSMLLLTAGARPQVWTEFDPDPKSLTYSPRLSMQARAFGSDQGWISYRLGPKEAKWTKADGVYSFRNDVARAPARLPSEAKIVLFHGAHDPWDAYVQANCPWVRDHWGTTRERAHA